MFSELTHLVESASAWAYVIVLLFAAVDVFVPLVPSESAVITGGVIAAAGDLSLLAILACAACGAFVGDNSAYYAASRVGERATRRIAKKESGRRRLAWASRQLEAHGAELIVAGRFVPGGRSAVALTAGTMRYSWRRFACLDVVAAALWAGYAGVLGYLGGRIFERSPWLALATALAIACAVTVVVELVRRLRRRNGHGGPLG
jgi:membrane protein DedA with SNARE-associated domain